MPVQISLRMMQCPPALQLLWVNDSRKDGKWVILPDIYRIYNPCTWGVFLATLFFSKKCLSSPDVCCVHWIHIATEAATGGVPIFSTQRAAGVPWPLAETLVGCDVLQRSESQGLEGAGWGFPQMKVPRNAWFIMAKPYEHEWFKGTPISGNFQMGLEIVCFAKVWMVCHDLRYVEAYSHVR